VSLDELNGRALDAAIAKHVFGLEVEERRNSRTGEPDHVYNVGRDAANPTWVRVPFYTASMGASITVDVQLQKLGWKRQWKRAGEPGGDRVVLEHAHGRRVEALGNPNEAICRAALKAVSS
jgi:hypothetical protein